MNKRETRLQSCYQKDYYKRKSLGACSISLLGLLAIVAVVIVLVTGNGVAQSGKSSGGLSSTVREVRFVSDTITIAGVLTLPTGNGPFPIVIWAHGSGKSNRKSAVIKVYTEEFLERGIGTLSPDKRGSDLSGGDWKVASFYDLAGDLEAAVEFVQTIPEVNQDRITLLGGSQGGQIVAIVGSHEAVDRVISFSSSVGPIAESIRDAVKLMGRNEGLSDEQIYDADSLNRLAMAFSKELAGVSPDGKWEDNEGAILAWKRYNEYRKKLLKSDLGNTKTITGFKSDSNHYVFRVVSLFGEFDPLDHWSKVSVPILFLFGARDPHVDVYKSIEVLAKRFDHSGNDYTILMFGTQGHMFIREDEMDFICRWIVEDD